MGVSGSFLDDDGVSSGESCDGSDGHENRRERHADEPQSERDRKKLFSRFALDRDLADVAFVDDLLDLLEEIVAGDLVLFGFG